MTIDDCEVSYLAQHVFHYCSKTVVEPWHEYVLEASFALIMCLGNETVARRES